MLLNLLVLILNLNSCIFCVPLLGNDHDIWSDSTTYNDNRLELYKSSRNISRIPRILNFFPVPVEEECVPKDERRRGICMNVYECRIQGGKSHGKCALGFGVCCIFKATCNQEIVNNLTYFVNPDFPDLTRDMTSCNLTVKKIDEEIAQLRLDFIHFSLGQPNRKTGLCEDDVFIMSNKKTKELKLCGINSGQHVYFDVEETVEPIQITMNLNRKAATRLWEVVVTQIPFSQRAPTGCLQYYTGSRGTVQTMNFADNGRHLANQDYNICIRQEQSMCTIAYEPCHENSFRISPNNNATRNNVTAIEEDLAEGSGGGQNFATSTQSRDLDQECIDKIILPCDNDDLIILEENGPISTCNLIHCGNSLCPEKVNKCRIESSTTPFMIGVHFEENSRETSPDDNIGMCLNYEQLPCN